MSVMTKGSKGEEVRAIQQALKDMGFSLEVDGHFGEVTHNCVIAMQVIFGYDVDGKVGPATSKLIAHQKGLGFSLAAARQNSYVKAHS